MTLDSDQRLYRRTHSQRLKGIIQQGSSLAGLHEKVNGFFFFFFPMISLNRKAQAGKKTTDYIRLPTGNTASVNECQVYNMLGRHPTQPCLTLRRPLNVALNCQSCYQNRSGNLQAMFKLQMLETFHKSRARLATKNVDNAGYLWDLLLRCIFFIGNE